MDVQLSFDLGQVLTMAQNVPASSTVPGISANLSVKNGSTSPSSDPAQTGSVNGYFGHPKHGVFMVYQAGTEQGSNQNYAYFAISSQVPFNLTQLQVRLELNKTANAGGVVVAVESSIRDDFTSYQTVGTLSPSPLTPVLSSTTVPLALYVPVGLTYLRLRATSTVGGDNTSGLAYSNLVLSGSLVSALGSGLTSPAPIDPQTTQAPSTTGSFIIGYDLAHTADFAQRVGVIGVATHGVASILGTNAPTPTDAEVEQHAPFSSVGVSDDGQKAFRLFNFGTQRGASQNYLWALVSNKLPLIIQGIALSFTPSVAGSSAISLAAATMDGPESGVTIISPNTLALAVEASVTADFQNPVTLGSVSTSFGSGPTSTVVETTALLPRGSSFIRLRAMTPTPTGNATDHIAFTSISINCAPVQDAWQQVGAGPVRGVLTYSNMLFSVSDADGTIWQYSGQPDSWTRIGDAADQFVGCDGGLYSLSNSEAAGASSAIKQWNQLNGQWDDIGPTTPEWKLNYLLTGFNTLFGVDGTNGLWICVGPTAWVRLGGPFSKVVATDQYCFAMASDDDQQLVQMLPVQGSTQWTTIGGPSGMSSLLAAGNALYALDGKGAVFRWSGQGTAWTLIDQGPFQRLALDGDSVGLLGITADGLAVLQLVGDGSGSGSGSGGGPLLRWDFMGQNMTTLCANRLWVAGVRDGGVFLYFRPQQQESGGGARPTMTALSVSAAPAPAPAPPSAQPPQLGLNWIFRYHTADLIFAGYDGTINVTLRAGDKSVSTALPAQHYVRNETTVVGLVITGLPPGDVAPLSTLSLIGINSFNPWYTDHWTVETMEAWDLESNTMYEFPIRGDVPALELNAGRDTRPLVVAPSLTTTVPRPPTYGRVLIWKFLGLKSAVGHASITLPDPDGGPDLYISWWPSNADRKYLPFVRLTYTAPANNNQTWENDSTWERSDPEFVLPVFGLDGSAVKNWWKGFNVPGATWNAASMNCSTVVYLALLNGGVIPEDLKGRLAYLGPWTPNLIMELTMALVTKKYPAWATTGPFGPNTTF